MNLKPVSIFQVLRTSAALLAFGGHAVLALAQGGPAVVGEATMVIGQASLVGADGATRPVARGESIRAGDRIETQAGGHVHVRFVDGGRLSVRPSSRLHVENYAHSDQQPQMSAIRFRLEEGVVRSITGAWGEASRDRFRLNTPVAAIGIKGTDFVVKADAGATAASVYSGAIMLSPLSEGCGSTLGPCLNGNEKLLSEDMKGFMLELSKGQGAPQLVAAVDLMAGARKPGAPVSVAGVSASQVPTVEGAPRQGGGTDKMVVGETLAAEAVQLASLVRAPERQSQLVWGRYGWVGDGAGADLLSKSFAEASDQGRELLVAGVSHALFREASAPGSVLSTSEPSVGFRITGSSASYQRYHDLLVEPATVAGGTLRIDFARSTFATELGVSSTSMGVENITASGSVTANGVFRTEVANARVLGGTSLDGKEAGYLFEKNMTAGALRGITLWGR